MLFGKEVQLGQEGLDFSEQVVHPEPAVYYLKDMSQVFLEKSNDDLGKKIFSVYHGVCQKEHEHIFLENNIRYDLTLLYPGKIGNEFSKTNGHFHANKANSMETFPEYYEVLNGEALFLLQKNNRSGEVEEILAIEAKQNDKVYIPPNYGHLVINPTNEVLVLGGLRERSFNYIVETFSAKKGAAYYYIETEQGKGDFIKNLNYHNSVGLQIMAAPSITPLIEFASDKDLYDNFILMPEKFNILK